MEATPESHNGTKGPSSPVVVEEQPISISALRSKFENLSAGGAGGIKTSTGKTWKRPDTGLSNLIPAPGWAGQSGQSRNGAGDSLARYGDPTHRLPEGLRIADAGQICYSGSCNSLRLHTRRKCFNFGSCFPSPSQRNRRKAPWCPDPNTCRSRFRIPLPARPPG